MTARIVVSCDGHRHGQPCRGAYTAHADVFADDHRRDAFREATQHGWHCDSTDGRDLCPSHGHDEEPSR